MFPEDPAGAVQGDWVDAAVQERETESDDPQRVPPAVVVFLCGWTEEKPKIKVLVTWIEEWCMSPNSWILCETSHWFDSRDK